MNQTEIVNIIIKTINTIFSNFFSSIDSSIYDNLDSLVFFNSDIMTNNFFSKFLGNNKNSLIYLSDSMIIAVAIFYVVRFYYSNMVDANVERPHQFLFKLLIFAFFINFSYFIIEQILNLNFLFSSSIQEIGKNVTGFDINFSELIVSLNKKIDIDSGEFNLFSFDGIIKSFVSVGFFNLIFMYSLRYVFVQVLILFSPFAFLSLINSTTAWIFKNWFRTLCCLLVIQVFVPLVIIVIFCIENNKILYVGGIYTLIKINDYIREIFGGISLNVNQNFGSMFSLIKK